LYKPKGPKDKCMFTTGDSFNLARNCPGTPSPYVSGNTIYPVATSTHSTGLQLDVAAVLVIDSSVEPPVIDIKPREAITRRYLFMGYMPSTSLMPRDVEGDTNTVGELKSGFLVL